MLYKRISLQYNNKTCQMLGIYYFLLGHDHNLDKRFGKFTGLKWYSTFYLVSRFVNTFTHTVLYTNGKCCMKNI